MLVAMVAVGAAAAAGCHAPPPPEPPPVITDPCTALSNAVQRYAVPSSLPNDPKELIAMKEAARRAARSLASLAIADVELDRERRAIVTIEERLTETLMRTAMRLILFHEAGPETAPDVRELLTLTEKSLDAAHDELQPHHDALAARCPRHRFGTSWVD